MNAFRSRTSSAVAYDILPPEERRVRARKPAPEVIDVDFVTVDERQPKAARRASTRQAYGHLFEQPVVPPKMSLYSRLAASLLDGAERRLARLSADSFSAVVALVFLLVFGFAGGFSMFLQDGQASDASGLDITHVSLTPQDADGMRVLLINGIVENRGTTGLSVPPIKADILVGGQVVASTLIDPPAAQMPKAQSRGFSARVPHPGGKAPELRLSFAEAGASRS